MIKRIGAKEGVSSTCGIHILHLSFAPIDNLKVGKRDERCKITTGVTVEHWEICHIADDHSRLFVNKR